MTSLHSGTLSLSCVCPKVPPASGIEPGISQRKTPLGVRGCAFPVERLRGSDTAQVQRGHVVNDRQLAVLRSTPLHKSLAQVGQVTVSDAETCHNEAPGLLEIACQSSGDLGKISQGSGQAVADFARLRKPSSSRSPHAS